MPRQTEGRRTEVIRQIATEVRTSQNQTDSLDEAAAALMGLNRTDHRCLDILERRGSIPAGDLAAASGLTTGAITAVLDRLEKAGYARRVKDSEDRRRILVELTPRAIRDAMVIYGPIAEGYLEEVERYTTDELELILDFVSRGRSFGERQLERVQALARARRARRPRK